MSEWVKRKVWVVTIYLADKDEDGEDMNWSSPSESYYADTREEAERMRDKFLNGEDVFYRSLVEDCIISDEQEEREFWQ